MDELAVRLLTHWPLCPTMHLCSQQRFIVLLLCAQTCSWSLGMKRTTASLPPGLLTGSCGQNLQGAVGPGLSLRWGEHRSPGAQSKEGGLPGRG